MKLRKLGIFAAAFVVLTASAAETNFCGRPEPHPTDVWLEQALDKSGGVTAAIREAQSEAHRRWDKELNETYRGLLAKLPEREKKQLTETQRTWLKYRELETKFLWSDSMFGQEGTLGPIAVADRLLENLKARVCELQQSPRYLAK